MGVDCYFNTKLHGFHRAKELAVAYRKRLEAEWEEAEAGWKRIDDERVAQRIADRENRELLNRLKHAQTTQSATKIDVSRA